MLEFPFQWVSGCSRTKRAPNFLWERYIEGLRSEVIDLSRVFKLSISLVCLVAGGTMYSVEVVFLLVPDFPHMGERRFRGHRRLTKSNIFLKLFFFFFPPDVHVACSIGRGTELNFWLRFFVFIAFLFACSLLYFFSPFCVCVGGGGATGFLVIPLNAFLKYILLKQWSLEEKKVTWISSRLHFQNLRYLVQRNSLKLSVLLWGLKCTSARYMQVEEQ